MDLVRCSCTAVQIRVRKSGFQATAMTSFSVTLCQCISSSVGCSNNPVQLLYSPCATAGAGAVKGNLRALNQSVSSQVAMLMKDPTKLVRRAGVSTEQRPRVLCHVAEPPAEPAVNPTGKQAAAVGLSENGSVKGTTSVGEELDLEAFDDGEFYAQLLKEFLDSSGGTAGVTGSALYPQVRLYKHQA